MILKKPYAFLIKKFRIIHIILTILIAFLLIKSYNLYNFFSRYVNNIYATLSDAIPSHYITAFMFLVSILIVALSISIFFLMKKKKKPRVLYILLSIYYLIFLVVIICYFIILQNIETVSLSIKDAMVYRDLALILFLPQIVFFIVTLIRGIGFDIKKFNFSKDLKELELEDEDSEEFEFLLGHNDYKYKRAFRKKIRDFRYYFLENKFIFTVLIGLSITVISIILVLNFTVYNRTYGKNQKVVANNLAIQVNNSYLTNIDYTGQIIEKGKYFLIVNMSFSNTSGFSTVLNLSSYELKVGDKTVYPTLSRNNYFVDLGAGYQKEKIENGKDANYILVYELNENQRSKQYMLRIVDEIEYKAGIINSKYKNVPLKPLVFDNVEVVKEDKLNNQITMYESILNNSSVTLESFAFSNKFTYTYEACIRSSCSNKTDTVIPDAAKRKTLLVVSGTLNLDTNSTF